MKSIPNKVLIIPDKDTEKIKLGGHFIFTPYGVSGRDHAWKDRVVTGTVAIDTEIDYTEDGRTYTEAFEEGDRVLFHFNLYGRDLKDDASTEIEGDKYVVAHPSQVFVRWRGDDMTALGPWVLTERTVQTDDVVLASGLILPGSQVMTDDAKENEGALLNKGVCHGAGWDDVMEGDTLIFPSSNRVEISLIGEAGMVDKKQVVYRQHRDLIWGYIRDGELKMLGTNILLKYEKVKETTPGGIYIPPAFLRPEKYTNGEVVKAGPDSLVQVGEKVGFNDVTRWRFNYGGEEYAVVRGDEEGIFFVYE